MVEIKQTSVFEKWESRLKEAGQNHYATRVMRLSQGLPSDVEPVGGGVRSGLNVAG